MIVSQFITVDLYWFDYKTDDIICCCCGDSNIAFCSYPSKPCRGWKTCPSVCFGHEHHEHHGCVTDIFLSTIATQQWRQMVPIWMQTNELRYLLSALLFFVFLSTKLRDGVNWRPECLVQQKVTAVGCGRVCVCACVRWGGQYFSVSVLQA